MDKNKLDRDLEAAIAEGNPIKINAAIDACQEYLAQQPEPEEEPPCPICGGTGTTIAEVRQYGNTKCTDFKTCDHCGGTGLGS